MLCLWIVVSMNYWVYKLPFLRIVVSMNCLFLFVTSMNYNVYELSFYVLTFYELSFFELSFHEFSFYELSYLWIVKSMNFNVYEIWIVVSSKCLFLCVNTICLWIDKPMNCLSMNYHTYEFKYLWIIMSMNCHIYELSYLWTVMSINCHVCELSCLWIFMSMIYCVSMSCTVQDYLSTSCLLIGLLNEMYKSLTFLYAHDNETKNM